MDCYAVTPLFTVARCPPTPADLGRLANEGFRSVVNLGIAGEEGEILSPAEERREAERLGLAYLHIPVPCGLMNEEVINRFRREVSALPEPVFVHCVSGRRSMICTLIHLCLEEGLAFDDVLARAKDMGVSLAPPLDRFVHDYVERDHETYERLERNLW